MQSHSDQSITDPTITVQKTNLPDSTQLMAARFKIEVVKIELQQNLESKLKM